MSVRRIATKKSLPPDPSWVSIPRTDGDRKNWPANTEKVVSADGHVNFMRPVPIDEGVCITWRCQLGTRVAAALGLPLGPTYVLKDWPAGYHMYDHNKGPASNPRHDAYLIAGIAKFRSINEFIPHAEWLSRDATMDRSNCVCKYCTKRPQKEISHGLGLSMRTSASSSPAPTQRTRKPPPTRPPHATIRKPPPKEQKLHPGPKTALSPEKDNDILDSLTLRDIQGIRYFRSGELVWCALSSPISPSSADEDGIEFWPGVIEMMNTKAEAVPRDHEQDISSTQREDSHRPSTDAPKPTISWKPTQSRVYRIKLLATAHTIPFSDHDLLPYLAYAPSDSMIHGLQQYLPEGFHSPNSAIIAEDISKQFDFNPFAEVGSGEAAVFARFREAVIPCALAIQIASHIAGFWTPTDEWDFKFTLNVPAASPTATDPSLSIQDLLDAEKAGVPLPNVPSALTVPRTVTQLRYQGLWWGAERIWTEELVRLKLARYQFVPAGNDIVYPPAGPSKTTQEWNTQHDIPSGDPLSGSGEKGLFMKIDGLFVVDTDSKDGSGKIKECRASGMIYELVDHDWDGGDDQVALLPDTNNKGKGRASDSASAPSSTQNGTKDGFHPFTPPRPILTATYPLPDPPMGYKFKPVLQPGNEVVLSLSLISGRYYPHLFSHPRLRKILQQAVEATASDMSGLAQNKHVWAMQGLLPGVHQSMDPVTWKPTRYMMFSEADASAREQLRSTREQIFKRQDGDVPMDEVVDGPSESISAAGSSISARI
ncbi:hypothetical protein PHLGIDRAFT_78231 [Phlebiopsis gigantea 11061_1 CR5-6]|uniref:Cryptic loci regulator 2 N-terminal domain-containing protein n=1 Tax=Phlebiopsis gigantea (strain 11061_1 CR5-6) TaxID=745531 RepID=A0A0C3S1A1_PHLG1|nr:hypothetical protein PHLGIDRAFT_78231 [Phlebiopsis gigantea 11061_1 CR5-6]